MGWMNIHLHAALSFLQSQLEGTLLTLGISADTVRDSYGVIGRLLARPHRRLEVQRPAILYPAVLLFGGWPINRTFIE